MATRAKRGLAATNALGDICDPDVLPALVAGFRDQDEPVRVAYLNGFGP